MKKILIFITGLVSCTAVIAAETAQPQWQPAQSLSTTPTTALPPAPAPAPAPAPVTVAQPAVTSPSSTGVPAPESAGMESAPPAPMPPDAALQYAENVTVPLSPEAIKQLRSGLDGVQRSSGTAPVTAAPRIRSLTVKLEPGSSLPMVQVLPNFPGVV
ncbi:conjugal transfer protein TraN, partial [Salmonella enterica]|nr:conjugal transfer protein TraN [Salmonella enterica]